MMELQNAVDYFPYIGHNLNREKLLKGSLWHNVIGTLFNERNITYLDDKIILKGDAGAFLFKEVIVNGGNEARKIGRDSFSVGAVVVRHRSLYDYGIGMPVHFRLINPEMMLVAGSNLFVAAYDNLLRHYGAFMFLREDAILKKKGFPKVFLSIDRYLQEVFPAYLNLQMFEGVGEQKLKRDMIVYPEQEKNPVTKKRNGGRSKSGKLRDLSPIFFEKFRSLTRGSKTRLFIIPVSISFSKYPDATFLVHPTKHKGIIHNLRYIHEQDFVGSAYPHYARCHPEAKLEAIVNYGRPEFFNGDDFKSFGDIFKYTKELRTRIGLLECIFPSTFIFRAMEGKSEKSLFDLGETAKKFHAHYAELGINLEKISDRQGNLLPIKEIVDRMVTAINSHSWYRIFGSQTKKFAVCRSDRFFTLDTKLQEWYANTILHLDP